VQNESLRTKVKITKKITIIPKTDLSIVEKGKSAFHCGFASEMPVSFSIEYNKQ
jgi:hypothetical protein